ncbi:MAG: twin-arginine translocation signal domain-containing protein [Cyclobacteriaceae bacterium]
MKTNTNSRRDFMGKLAVGATAGLAFVSNPLQVSSKSITPILDGKLDQTGEKADRALKALGKKSYPIAYDMSSVNPYGIVWSNVYYMTNSETGTSPADLGVACICRHHGMIFALNDSVIKKYALGEFIGLNDPVSKSPAVSNPYYILKDGTFPLAGLEGIKALSEKGCYFFVCDMARKVYAQFVAQKIGSTTEEVYADFVAGTLPGVIVAPSGVWALGRLAENKIGYIDASVG